MHANTPMNTDVPITVDFRLDTHARDWTASAMALRPWRATFFDTYADIVAAASTHAPCRVLELGSGPGFLAHRLLSSLRSLTYVALDFSAAMHELARQRLADLPDLGARVQFLERNLRDADWGQGLGQFQFVITHQAVHELRHKRYAPALHAQARERLLPGGGYLVCDHFFGQGGMSNAELYMTVQEQREALLQAGFVHIDEVLNQGGLVLHHARP